MYLMNTDMICILYNVYYNGMIRSDNILLNRHIVHVLIYIPLMHHDPR